MNIQIFTVMTEEQFRSLDESGRNALSVCAQLNALITQLSTSAPTITPATMKAFFNHCGVLVVALDAHGRIVGIGTLVFVYKMTDITARIEHVVVDKHFRGQHISPRIMAALIEASVAQQVRYTDLTTGPDRIEANGLYQKLGFKKRDTNYYRLMGRI